MTRLLVQQQEPEEPEILQGLRLFEITAAAMIPLLSGYVSQCEGSIRGGLPGFCVAVVAGALGLFQYQELWVNTAPHARH